MRNTIPRMIIAELKLDVIFQTIRTMGAAIAIRVINPRQVLTVFPILQMMTAKNKIIHSLAISAGWMDRPPIRNQRFAWFDS